MRPKTEIGTEPKWIRNELFLRRPAFYLSRCHYLFIQSTLKLNWSDGGHMERNGMFLSVSGRLNLPSLLNMSPLKCLLTKISSLLTLAANAAHTRTLLMIMLPTVSHVTSLTSLCMGGVSSLTSRLRLSACPGLWRPKPRHTPGNTGLHRVRGHQPGQQSRVNKNENNVCHTTKNVSIEI